ncbi:GAF domain-containing protein [Paenarthrobacter sp. NPDC090522]|uniref:GAF domain-containing sensor histidine kinase n=1 Tax=Paenarthrobacter sp. NPDC090522 TaxID=3364383 RepID=UPI00382B6798
MIVYAHAGEPTRIIACDSLGDQGFLPDEPVRLELKWKAEAWTERRVTLRSLMTSAWAQLQQVLVLPFSDDLGRGAVLLGSATTLDSAKNVGVDEFVREFTTLRAGVDATRHRDIDRAYRAVARAATSDLSLDKVFDITLAAARNLLEGDVAYLSLPVDDEYFAFTRTLGITTDVFRDLRVGLGEGLGGAARELGKPVRSLNYEADRHLRSAPRVETRTEGLYSALAVPVQDRGRVEAVLYVASRKPHAYSQNDEAVLADFASAALLGLNRSALDESRRELVREQERARLAQKLHDDLVRRLTHIGFAAAQLEHDPDRNGRSHAQAITTSVGECMTLVRDELRDLLSELQDRESTLQMVADRIFDVPALSGMRRMASFTKDGYDGSPVVRIPTDVADAMCKVGQEAVFNAENHSHGTICDLNFDVQEGHCVMTVSDNGSSFNDAGARGGHYGIEFMKREVGRVGGEVQFTASESGGFAVRASFPIGTSQWGHG